jgi:hypothetical protein
VVELNAHLWCLCREQWVGRVVLRNVRVERPRRWTEAQRSDAGK